MFSSFYVFKIYHALFVLTFLNLTILFFKADLVIEPKEANFKVDDKIIIKCILNIIKYIVYHSKNQGRKKC